MERHEVNEDKLIKVIELQANLLIRLAPNLSEDDRAEVVMVQNQAQAILGEKVKPARPERSRKIKKNTGDNRKRGKQRRGKEWEGETF